MKVTSSAVFRSSALVCTLTPFCSPSKPSGPPDRAVDVGWLDAWLVGWSLISERPENWLVGWLVGWLVSWLVGWLVGWLADEQDPLGFIW